MSDRMAVMTEGKVEQLGTPSEVYETPTSSYIADFLGISNLMYATSTGEGRVTLGSRHFDCVSKDGASGEVTVSIRPERIELHPPDYTGDNVLNGEIERVVFAGPLLNVLVNIAEVGMIQVTIPNQGAAFTWDWPDPVALRFPPEALRIVSETGTATEELDGDQE
jgi:ABC-type Fe3+/spermidine/putrescine transport system ATPase subunit